MKENKTSLAKSAVLMGIIILASKALGLLRDILIAAAYGTTEAAVAYETASKLPVTIFDFVLGGVVTAAFIPVYNSLAVKKGKKEAVSFCQSYVNLILVITVTLSVLGVVFAPTLVDLIAPKLAESTRLMAASLTRIMFPMVIFVGLAFSFVGFLQSEGEYNIPAVISLVSNLLMVAYLVFFNDKFGVTGLSVAMLIGWGAQAAVQIPFAWRRGFRFRLTAPLGTPEIRRAAGNTLPILIATWTTPVCNLINTRLASGIEGGRAITALSYANRLYIILVGLFSFVATNLIFPMIARAAAAGEKEESDRLTRSSIKTLIYLIAPLSAGVMVLAEPFVALIYENGTFNASDTLLTAEALRFYAVGMIFAAVAEVLIKACFAAELTVFPMISSLISMAFNAAVVLLFGSRLGIGGIAAVTALATLINMLVNLLFACRKKLITPIGADLIDAAKSLLAAVLMGAAVWFAARLTADMGRIPAFVLPVFAGVAVYAVLTFLLRSETVGVLLSKLTKNTD